MPLVLWVFLIGGSMGLGAAMADPTAPVWGRVDRMAHTSGSYRCEEGYRSWSSPQWNSVADRDTRTCSIHWFAVSNCRKEVRLRVGPEDRGLDWSWHFRSTAAADSRQQVTLTFIDPVSGKTLAQQTLGVNCLPWSPSGT
jgi:hypothetical protein